MKIKNKDDIILAKFKLSHRDIFLNTNFLSGIQNHFDSKLGFASFIIGLLDNQLGYKKTQKHIEINIAEWQKLLSDLYSNEKIKNVFAELSLNPIIEFDNIVKSFDCFDTPINKIISYFEIENFNLNINKNQLKFILKSAFSYILYNCIDCKIPYKLKDILGDQDYDQKFTMILNNTKLFAIVKNAIVSSCGGKINDLISLLLGISRDLSD